MRTIYTALGWRLNQIKRAITKAQATEDPLLRREQYDRINGFLREMHMVCIVNGVDLEAYLQRHGLSPEKNRAGTVKALTISYT